VYVFLFQSFPLGDKSSVNLRGNFHVENVTTFEEFLKASVSEEDDVQTRANAPEDVNDEPQPEMTVAKPEEKDQPAEGTPSTKEIDELYPVFWALQHSFANPPRLFEEESFKEFQKSLETTLAKFKEVPKVIQSGDSEHKKSAKSQLDDDHDEFASTFNPKYLTSRDLFKLEVRTSFQGELANH
jgi:THO complex subunit 1